MPMPICERSTSGQSASTIDSPPCNLEGSSTDSDVAPQVDRFGVAIEEGSKPCWADLSSDDESTGVETHDAGDEENPSGEDHAHALSTREKVVVKEDGPHAAGVKGARPIGRAPRSIAPALSSSTSDNVLKGRGTKTPLPVRSPAVPDLWLKGPIPVVLEGLPLELCNDACFETILHQTGLQHAILGYQMHKGGDCGRVEISFSNQLAAEHCYQHFARCSWLTCRLQVHIASQGADLLGQRKQDVGSVINKEAAGRPKKSAPFKSRGQQRRDAGPKVQEEGLEHAPWPYLATSRAHQIAWASAHAHAHAGARIS